MFGGNSGGNFNNDAFGAFKPSTGQTSTFGSSQNQPFSAFKNANSTPASAFGAPASGTSLFGSTAPKIGTAGGLFGNAQNTATSGSLFGSAQTNATQTSLFGSNSNALQKPTQSSIFGTNVTSGTTIKFDPLKATDTMVKNNESKQINTKHMCITAMKQYESKSLEELRVEDYLANRKTSQCASSNLFGTRNTSSTAPASAFGVPASGTSIFATKIGTTGGLFGNTQNVGASGSLFGTASANTPQTSLFGNTANALQKPAQPTMFGANASSVTPFGTQASGASIFSSTAPKIGTTGGIFGNTQNVGASGSLFGTASANTPQTSLFGNTANALQKPAQPTMFGANASGVTPFGTQPSGTSIFASTAPKIGATSGLFGNTQSTNAGGSIFGTTSTNTPQASMFGINALQKPTQLTAFGGANAQQPSFTGNATFNNAGSPPIVLGSNVDVSSIQHAIIDAQLSSLPYGDSPLLRMSSQSPKEEKHKSPPITSTGLQRQLRFLSARVDNGSSCSPTSNSSIPASSAVISSNNMPVAGADLNNSALGGRFSYKPLISLPSVGFGAALGLNSSNRLFSNSPTGPSLQKNRSFLAQDCDEMNSERNSFSSPSGLSVRKPKSLDISVVHKSSSSRLSPVCTASSNIDNYTPLANKQNSTDESFVIVPPLSIDNGTDSVLSVNDESISERSPLVDKTSSSINSPQKNSVKLSRPEYYCEPSKKAIEESFSNGLYNIETGLTVGRLGYGSVFWRGPFQLTNLNLDDIVHFRSKEIIVYPDEATKPEVGTELNRPAEVSLERVWPVGKEKQLIKDPDELAKLNFREKLERICLKMGATFKDYQPNTGTWQLSVSHFSKYGLLEEEEEEEVAMPTPEELDILEDQRMKLSVVQRAKQPFREIQMIDSTEKSVSANILIYRPAKEFKIPKSESTGGDGLTSMLDIDGVHLSSKKFKYDGSLYEQKIQLRYESPSLINQSECPALKMRPTINNFTGLTTLMLKDSVLSSTGLAIKALSFNSRRSCRIGFGQEFICIYQNEHQFLTSVNISKIAVVPCVEQYFKEYLKTNGREGELKKFKKSELLRWNPPSLMLKLVDLFVLDAKKVKHDGINRQITSLCDGLLLPAFPDSGIMQRVRFGFWLRDQLSKNCEAVLSFKIAENDKFSAIYLYLINGSVQKAVEEAKSKRLYNLALLISLFCIPATSFIQDQISEQAKKILFLRKKNSAKSDTYYEKILNVMSGIKQYDELQCDQEFCLAGCNWMQALGVIIWYWSKPSATLLECVQQYEELARNGLINDKDLYA